MPDDLLIKIESYVYNDWSANSLYVNISCNGMAFSEGRTAIIDSTPTKESENGGIWLK